MGFSNYYTSLIVTQYLCVNVITWGCKKWQQIDNVLCERPLKYDTSLAEKLLLSK